MKEQIQDPVNKVSAIFEKYSSNAIRSVGTGCNHDEYILAKDFWQIIQEILQIFIPPHAPIKTEGEDEKDFDLLAEYDMKEKVERIVTHVFTKVPEDNKVNFLTNYINGLVGSAILHHHNRYVKKLNVPDFKTTFK